MNEEIIKKNNDALVDYESCRNLYNEFERNLKADHTKEEEKNIKNNFREYKSVFKNERIISSETLTTYSYFAEAYDKRSGFENFILAEKKRRDNVAHLEEQRKQDIAMEEKGKALVLEKGGHNGRKK